MGMGALRRAVGGGFVGASNDGCVIMNLLLSNLGGSLFAQSLSLDAVISVSLTLAAWGDGRCVCGGEGNFWGRIGGNFGVC